VRAIVQTMVLIKISILADYFMVSLADLLA
jgi:hypothetical protein